jgi:hypothetical protein
MDCNGHWVAWFSLTRDVPNAELCLGHFDCCSLEHERLGM